MYCSGGTNTKGLALTIEPSIAVTLCNLVNYLPVRLGVVDQCALRGQLSHRLVQAPLVGVPPQVGAVIVIGTKNKTIYSQFIIRVGGGVTSGKGTEGIVS